MIVVPFLFSFRCPVILLKREFWLWLILLVGLVTYTLAWTEKSGIPESVIRWVEDRYGGDARERVEDWNALIHRYKNSDEKIKLTVVNDFFNDVPYYSDYRLWGQKDYWATPIEMLAEDGGDCEDYAIAKYYTLRQMGVDDTKLRISYVKALRLNEAHMVLTYYETPSSVPLVLDNVETYIEKATERTDLEPVYSFNGDGLWLAVKRAEGKRVGDSQRISLWQGLLSKLGQEMEN
jgi:predicted transglutaminase-like cysteine proteinase